MKTKFEIRPSVLLFVDDAINSATYNRKIFAFVNTHRAFGYYNDAQLSIQKLCSLKQKPLP